jgi:recombination protein RecA
MAKNTKKTDLTINGSGEISKRELADLAMKQIRSNFGEGAIMRMGDQATVEHEIISTGIMGIDIALGVGGFAKGRIVEIYGPEASGKTSIALSTIAQAQKAGGVAAFIDAEHALDPTLATNIGVDIKDLYLSQPNSGEEALEIVDNLVRANAFDVIVIDSVAALVPKSELEGDMGDSSMGVQARLMSQALRKLTGAVARSKTCVIFINQLRLKIGVVFGSPETTTGGQALKFYASQRLEVRKSGSLKSGEDHIGNRVTVKVVKNKLYPPFKSAQFDMIFNEKGIFSKAGEIIDLGIPYGVIEKSGNTYTAVDKEEKIKLGVGREAAKKALLEKPELMQNLELEIKEKIKNKVQPLI